MAAVAVQAQQIETIHARTFVHTFFVYNTSGDTVSIPVGSFAGACLATNSTDTAPTVSLAQGLTNDTATLTGGTVGKAYVLVTRHTGTPSAR